MQHFTNFILQLLLSSTLSMIMAYMALQYQVPPLLTVFSFLYTQVLFVSLLYSSPWLTISKQNMWSLIWSVDWINQSISYQARSRLLQLIFSRSRTKIFSLRSICWILRPVIRWLLIYSCLLLLLLLLLLLASSSSSSSLWSSSSLSPLLLYYQHHFHS